MIALHDHTGCDEWSVIEWSVINQGDPEIPCFSRYLIVVGSWQRQPVGLGGSLHCYLTIIDRWRCSELSRLLGPVDMDGSLVF